jgi:hypothetical protein
MFKFQKFSLFFRRPAHPEYQRKSAILKASPLPQKSISAQVPSNRMKFSGYGGAVVRRL